MNSVIPTSGEAQNSTSQLDDMERKNKQTWSTPKIEILPCSLTLGNTPGSGDGNVPFGPSKAPGG